MNWMSEMEGEMREWRENMMLIMEKENVDRN